MLPNQFCYQIPLQFFTPQIPQNNPSPPQNFNPYNNFSINPLFQSSQFSTAFPNNTNFINFYPCQFQINEFTGSSEVDQKIAILVPCRKQTDQSSQIQKNQIQNRKKQAQKVLTEGCICSKTGCVKEYCRCFKNGKACTDECRCHQCRNLLDSESQVKKKSKSSKTTKCNCKKSKCSNKYCDCLVAGRACGKQCNCCDCSNH